jgi:signal transduction histidine kinase
MSETAASPVLYSRLGIAGIVGGTLAISILHHTTPASQLHWHNVLQHLYYVPTVLAALMFGWRGGLAAGALAGLTHFPDILQTLTGSRDSALEQIIEIPVLCFVGMLTGFFSDRDRNQRREIERTTQRLTEVYRELQENFDQMKRAERLFAVGQLAAGLAHELRNPLASVAGAAGILQRNAHFEPRHKECLDIILKESQRLNRLLSEFLDFARPRAPHLERVVVEPVLDAVIQLASHGVGATSVRLRKEVSSNLPPIEGDGELIKQVLLNLVINAIQAMPDGGEVVVSAALEKQSVVIRVRDQGCGIAEGTRDRIFDPFFTTKEHGTGLGLAVAHQIVEQHGGVLRAEANAGRGMVFSAQLPIHREVPA